MKKFAIVSLFALVVLGLASAVVTGNTTGTVAMTGTAAAQLSLTLPTAYTAAMNDGSGTANSWSVGNIGVTSNYNSWTIAISSANGGYLVNTTNSAEKAQYTMTLGSLATSQSLSSAWTSAAQTKTLKAGVTYALSIAFTASTTTFWQTGSYTDTITVTIAGS
jgi:hypothetical protein